MKSYRNFGFEKPFLLFATHVANVPKLKKFVKFWYFVFGTAFGTLVHAQTLEFWGVCRSVPKTNVFDTVFTLQWYYRVPLPQVEDLLLLIICYCYPGPSPVG